MQLCNSLCWCCFSTVNLLKNWRSGIAWKKAESFAVHQLSSLPSLKSQSQTSYWEISDWKKRLWSEVKAFSFDLCWNAKYVSVWTFVLTRWRSKQRWACWKRTYKKNTHTHTHTILSGKNEFSTHLSACAATRPHTSLTFVITGKNDTSRIKLAFVLKHVWLEGTVSTVIINRNVSVMDSLSQLYQRQRPSSRQRERELGKESEGWKGYSPSHRTGDNEFLSTRLAFLIS